MTGESIRFVPTANYTRAAALPKTTGQFRSASFSSLYSSAVLEKCERNLPVCWIRIDDYFTHAGQYGSCALYSGMRFGLYTEAFAFERLFSPFRGMVRIGNTNTPLNSRYFCSNRNPRTYMCSFLVKTALHFN